MTKIDTSESSPASLADAFSPSPLLKKWNTEELRYSFVWEDINCLLGAMQKFEMSPKRILSIGSSGDNAIGMLAVDPEEIVVIDLSPAQLALVELKKAGLTELKFEEFLLFFMGSPGADADHLYRKCRGKISASNRDYWDQNREMLWGGIHLQGRLDQYFQKFRRQVLPLIWSADDFRALIVAPNLKEQATIWARGNQEILKSVVAQFFSRAALSREGRHESQFAYVEQSDIGPKFLERFMELISTQLIGENPYLTYFLTGKPGPPLSHPLWNESDFQLLRSRAERITLVCQDVESYLQLQQPDPIRSGAAKLKDLKFDFMNLSDLFEYLSEEQTAALFRQLADCLARAGRLGYWKLLVDRRPNLKSLREVTSQVSDRTWFYSAFSIFEKAE